MKNLSIQHTVIPEGWTPKPPVTAHNFLDWKTRQFYWQCMIYKIQGNENINDFANQIIKNFIIKKYGN